jgi:CO/xanthine dehydrogenase Mo-binding subunit
VCASHWGQPKSRPSIGRGMAVSHRHIGTGDANAEVRVESDGSVTLLTTVPDTGTGSHTILRQIVAEILTLPVEQVRVQVGTTDAFVLDSGAGGSRVTHVAGQATYQAALALQQQLCEIAATVLGCPTTVITLDNGACVVHSAPTQYLTFAEVAAAAGRRLLCAQKLYRVSQSPHMSPFTAQVVEVDVDPDTGQVTLLDVVTAHDVGTIINPLGHQGQIEGGLMQGIGYGLLEEMCIDEGRIGTLSLGEYKLPNIKDIPPLCTVLVQEEVGPAPFQGKAIGESSITPIAAAIANAVYDAVGVRLYDLPITAEKVYQDLQSREGSTP